MLQSPAGLRLKGGFFFRLEMVSLDDILIPSIQAGGSLYDVDTVHRILVNFLQREENEIRTVVKDKK
jgi:hypothetical protein